MTVKKKNSPLAYESGNPRLGPMSTAALQDLLGKCRPRHKNKIINEIAKRNK
jgi:hypothetical protein